MLSKKVRDLGVGMLGERSMALRFLIHFLKPNEGKGSWYAFMGNEVAHSSPFLANWFEPHLTQNAARRVALFGFRNTPGGLFGNDDLGCHLGMVCVDCDGDISGDSGRWRGDPGCSDVQGCGDIGTWGQVGEAGLE